MVQERVIFKSRLLPYLLVAPQIIITLVFFLWPAAQALYQSFLIEDAFGLGSEFVWLENYQVLFAELIIEFIYSYHFLLPCRRFCFDELCTDPRQFR